ncbi:hypothetical protein BJX76DRAFT_151898 [Aspergillus varians]
MAVSSALQSEITGTMPSASASTPASGDGSSSSSSSADNPNNNNKEKKKKKKKSNSSQPPQPHQKTKPKPKESVAVIGSGMAGLVTAHLLVRSRSGSGAGRFEVEVLEMQERLSLDSASYSLSSSSASSGVESILEKEDEEDEKEKADITEEEEEEESEQEEKRIDLPMRAFAAGYYDNLRRMYEYLGVSFAEPKFVYSLSRLASSDASSYSSLCKEEKKQGGVYFIHSSNNHILPPVRPSGVGVAVWTVEIAYLVFWYLWFTAACFLVVPRTSISNSSSGAGSGDVGESLRSYLTRIKIPTYYTWRYFLPLMSSITTCTHDQLLDFPASDIIGYARQTHRKPHYTVTGGVQEAEARLSRGLSVRFNTRVTDVESIKGGRVRVSWVTRGGEEEEEEEQGTKEYDRVIIAVTPDVVGAIFSPLRKEMGSIPTTTVQTVVHLDWARVGACNAYLRSSSRLRRRGFSSQASSSSSSTGSTAEKTPLTAMHMVSDANNTRTESIHEHPARVLVTTYAMDGGIDESKILHRVQFTRVLRTAQSQAVVNSIFATGSDPTSAVDDKNEEEEEEANSKKEGWKNGDGNVFIVGGWCWDGMVLLEGCIVSAMRVADALDVDVPWAC